MLGFSVYILSYNFLQDCDTNTAKCVQIICSIKSLRKGNSAYVDIKSRIWNSTLVEDYSKVDWVQIKSKIEIEITDKTFNISGESVRQFSVSIPNVYILFVYRYFCTFSKKIE